MVELYIMSATIILTGLIIVARASREVLPYRRRQALKRNIVTGIVFNLLFLGLVESIMIPTRQMRDASEFTHVGYIAKIDSTTMEGVRGAIGPIEVSRFTLTNGRRPSYGSTYLVDKEVANRFRIGQKVEMSCNKKPGEFPARSVQEICIPKAA